MESQVQPTIIYPKSSRKSLSVASNGTFRTTNFVVSGALDFFDFVSDL